MEPNEKKVKPVDWSVIEDAPTQKIVEGDVVIEGEDEYYGSEPEPEPTPMIGSDDEDEVQDDREEDEGFLREPDLAGYLDFFSMPLTERIALLRTYANYLSAIVRPASKRGPYQKRPRADTADIPEVGTPRGAVVARSTGARQQMKKPLKGFWKK